MTAPAVNNPPPTFAFNEQTTGQVTGQIVGNDGVTGIPAASLTTLILTLYVIKQDGTDGIVNSRNGQNVLNANNVTVDSAGNLLWIVQVGDTTMVEEIAFERHIARFEWTSPVGSGKFEVVLVVRDIHGIT